MNKYFAELLKTFALVFCGTGAIIINEQSNGAVTHAGIAITFGGIVMVTIYALKNIPGAYMNPARSIAPAIVSGHTKHLWVYIAAPIREQHSTPA